MNALAEPHAPIVPHQPDEGDARKVGARLPHAGIHGFEQCSFVYRVRMIIKTLSVPAAHAIALSLRIGTTVTAVLIAAAAPAAAQATSTPEATSLLGKPLYAVVPGGEAKKAAEAEVQAAREAAARQPESADMLIRLGRRLVAAGRVREAVDLYTSGIRKFPTDARFYRHRGHRYITVREFDKAIADLTKASQLIAGKPDQPEQATDPTALSSESLHYTVYYHLGLAHYLKGDFARALPEYRKCLEIAQRQNDDQIAGASDWLYMTLRRLGRTAEAAKQLELIVPGMKIKDDQQYYDRLFMYKGLKKPEELLGSGKDATADATLAYGVANWYLYNGRTDEAKALFEKIVTGRTGCPSASSPRKRSWRE